MTREQKVELLQHQVLHNRIDYQELKQECDKWGIDLHEDVLFPIGWNTCDRCNRIGDSVLDFIWVESYPWEEDNPKDQALLKALEQENLADYCTVCWECVKELTKKGE